jgi:hypothetical protein
MLWEWEDPYIHHLFWNAKTFGREVAQRYFADWPALAAANQRIWTRDYLPRQAYQPWDTWQAWMEEYREIVRDMQDIYEANHGRMPNNRRHAHQEGS